MPVGASGSAARMTFVFGSDGRVRRVYEKVSVLGHADGVLSAVKEIAAQEGPAGE